MSMNILLILQYSILTASVTLVVGAHGSVNLQLGPYSSSLIEINSVLIQSIKVFNQYLKFEHFLIVFVTNLDNYGVVIFMY